MKVRTLMRRRFGAVFALMALMIAATSPSAAQFDRKPLLMDGKSTLYQRVLTRPSAELVAAPGQKDGEPIDVLSVLYVYGRVKEGGTSFLEVGPNPRGTIKGYVAEAQTIEWKQSLVLSFANPAGREPVLFFRDEDSLLDLTEADNLKAEIAAIRAKISADGLSPTSPVIAKEPDQFVDIQKQFYLLPILDANLVVLPSRHRVTSVEIASVTAKAEDSALEKSDDVPDPTPPVPQQSARINEGIEGFNAAIVFVIDASSSMQAYIEQTREAVLQVYNRIEQAGIEDKVRFGLIGYRDDPKAVSGVDYLTRIFVKPNAKGDSKRFIELAKSLSASPVSTRTNEEDGIAGMMTAIDEVDWSEFGGRYVIFISDVSSREGSHRYSSTGISTAQVNERAVDKGIATYAVHLKTPENATDHARAEGQYRSLTSFPGLKEPLYYPVDAGDVQGFRKNVDILADAIIDVVDKASRGQLVPGMALDEEEQDKMLDRKPKIADALDQVADDDAKADKEDDEQQLKQKAETQAAVVGRAMQLSYLGSVQGTEAPPMFKAWAIDADLSRPEVKSLQVRVLLSKNQLSDLQAALREIIAVGVSSENARDTFFDQLRNAAAALSRDPTQVGKEEAETLSETGLLGEYLADLPYKSKVLELSEALWNSWSIPRQVSFLDELESKVRLYQRYHDDVNNWVFLNDGDAPGEAVYPIPLTALP
ncbi:MAG: vWA domain-containing protein [Pseudomonadota bacterium]